MNEKTWREKIQHAKSFLSEFLRACAKLDELQTSQIICIKLSLGMMSSVHTFNLLPTMICYHKIRNFSICSSLLIVYPFFVILFIPKAHNPTKGNKMN